MSDAILEIKNLTIAFGENEVVKNLSCTLQKGKTLVIVGESGSGKSVTSLALMGLLPKQAKITADALLFKSNDLLAISEGDFRKLRGKDVSMIFQEPMTSLNPVETCGWQVQEAILLHQKCSRKDAKKRTLGWLGC